MQYPRHLVQGDQGPVVTKCPGIRIGPLYPVGMSYEMPISAADRIGPLHMYPRHGLPGDYEGFNPVRHWV